MAQTDDYIALIAPAAQEAARRYDVWASVAIGQSILETGWGKSALAQRHNYFGVKWHHDPKGPFPEHVTGVYLHRTTERPDSGEYVTNAYFRTYANPLGSALDYADNLRTNPAYARTGAFDATTADDFIRRIGPVYTGGDSTYSGKVLDLMGRYNLRTYDTKEAINMNSPLVNRPSVPHRNKYGTRGAKITRVILHNWASTGGGDSWLARPEVKASTNYFVYSDGGIAVQVPEQYRAWTSGSASADNPSITIETQNSTMGPDWKVTDKALETIAQLLADIARRYGWGSITPDRLRGHREFQSTTCPGPYLWPRLGQIRDHAARILKGGGPAKPSPPPAPGWDGKPIKGGILTTPYGKRGRLWSTNRNAAGEGIHTGDDWNLPGGTPIGTPLHAVTDGTVTIADGGALGLMSILKGDNGRYYRYCHCRKGSRDPWNGERVRAGQKIAEVGNTGNVTAPHLHLEDTASAQLWPPVGHRKPSWPTPATPIAPPHIEEDPVPDFNRTVTELDHPGQTDPNDFDTGWRLPADDATVVPPSGKRLKIDANAIIHVPEGIQLTTRWVSWSGRVPPGWVRGANRRHESHQAETVHKGEQAWAGADLRLDVHVNKPCKVWIEQTAWTWELPD